METSRPSLLGATADELTHLAQELGEPGYRGRQLFASIFQRQHSAFAAMSDLPRAFREKLAEHFSLARPAVGGVQISKDGTRKFGFHTADGEVFEAVYIPEVARGGATNTLCISSQSGCSLGCAFCFTASLKRCRNLTAAEIVGQVLAANSDVATLGVRGAITNIVFMGMGEPLLNYGEVVKSARILMDPTGTGFTGRRVTVSTAGVVPRIHDLGRELPVQLAISLNATTDEVRDRIMPINRKWPLKELMAALKAYPLPNRRRFTIEYVLLEDVNDTLEDAKRLPRLLAGLPVKVNLLPLNQHERTDLRPPPMARVLRFQEQLLKAGIRAIIRNPRGQDIAAACGQLGGALRKSESSPTP
jgi:23S rRNA (adenine2503-C2)-methyltransferase